MAVCLAQGGSRQLLREAAPLLAAAASAGTAATGPLRPSIRIETSSRDPENSNARVTCVTTGKALETTSATRRLLGSPLGFLFDKLFTTAVSLAINALRGATDSADGPRQAV